MRGVDTVSLIRSAYNVNNVHDVQDVQSDCPHFPSQRFLVQLFHGLDEPLQRIIIVDMSRLPVFGRRNAIRNTQRAFPASWLYVKMPFALLNHHFGARADDHAVVRYGVKQLLGGQAGVEMCCEATTGAEAIEQVRKAKPEMNGLGAARQIREISSNTDILVLSMHHTEEIAREVLRSGARVCAEVGCECGPRHSCQSGASRRAIFHRLPRRNDSRRFRRAIQSIVFGHLAAIE